MKIFRKNRKQIAMFLLLNFALELIFPLRLYALTGGPSQPEVQSFQPIGVSDMVNPFSGDFSYNLPLVDVDGYPINLVYNSGITTDQEASWVGLGWNINPGVISRSMRGIPDEFAGDRVIKEYSRRPNITMGGSVSGSLDIFGKKVSDVLSLKMTLGLNYNNYNGYGFETSLSPSVQVSESSKGSLTAGIGLTSGSNGLSVKPSLSFDHATKFKDKQDSKIGGNIGCSFNSRAGLSNLTIGASGEYKDGGEKKNAGLSGEAVSFAMPSYTPVINMPMNNFSANFSYNTGGAAIGLYGNLGFSGYYSEQRLATNYMETPAYGYINSQARSLKDEQNAAMLDINRDWDGAFNMNTPAMPITNFTYDVLSVQGQGLGGSFRPFRNDIGFVTDNTAYNTSGSFSGSLEAGVGNTSHGGFDVSINSVNTTTQTWFKSNPVAQNYLGFENEGDDLLYEPYSYKEIGELSVDDEPEIYNGLGQESAVRVGLEDGGGLDVKTKPVYVTDGDANLNMSSKNYRSKRIKRNQVLQILTYKELAQKAITNNGGEDLVFSAPDHHIGEISVVRNDGARYVYGIPAFNVTQEETSFSVGMLEDRQDPNFKDDRVYRASVDHENGLVQYDYGDNTTANNRGKEHSYSSTTMPPYAHSYLLTAVLSPEYVDIDDTRGPSAGDIGNYTVFKYKKIEERYRWRTPFQQFRANFNEGMKSDNYDDQASYVYGEKELWYLDRIETKNTVAVFTTEDRDDGYGVINRDGGMGNQTMKLLRKISLYSRKDLEESGTPVPIKEVHFEYDYSLCPGVVNNKNNYDSDDGQYKKEEATHGKLTLKRVYFTYGTSFKSKFSPYDFDYTNEYDDNFNPRYGLKNYDRWGNYKDNTGGSFDPIPENTAPVHTSEYPYVKQDKELADKNTSAWALTSIQLPSGGKIQVNYESDDYAYVQNKKAMQMFHIVSIVNNPTGMSGSALINPDQDMLMAGHATNANNQFLVVKLSEPISSSGTPSDVFKKKYLHGIDQLYFRVLANMSEKLVKDKPYYEYVSGYADLDKDAANYVGTFSSTGSGNHDYAWIKLKTVNQGDDDGSSSTQVNPISRTIWQFARLHLSKMVLNREYPDDGGFEKFMGRVGDAVFVKNILQTLRGMNGTLKRKDIGKTINLDKSFIRLNNPTGFKYGGGSRVKKIVISDQWQNMVSASDDGEKLYGQEYTYTTTDEESNTISSGVAAYEPGIGGDENPFKQPIYFGDKKENLMIPDDVSYLEGPYCESFFPGPSVGYSKVKIKNIQPEEEVGTITKHGTGHVINEYYTAKDFPTITRKTTIDARPKKTNPVLRLLKIYNREYMTVSQGYSVELNDMHGKQKAMWVYAEDKPDAISGAEYFYQCEGRDDKSKELSNTATVIRPDGSTAEREIGVEYDFVVDFREQKTESVTSGMETNLSTFLAGIFPGIVPTVFPKASVEITRFRSAIATKVINKYGILKETVAHDLGSRVSTSNLAYDSESGLVLLTKTHNEFNDVYYSFNYPAHWHYEGMGQAYKNLGLNITLDLDGSSIATLTDADKYFIEGDEVVTSSGHIGWVKEVTSGSVTFMNEMGNPMLPGTNDVKMRIVRSGRRNMIGVSMGSVVTMTNPMEGLRNNVFTNVLNSSAQVFKDEWQTYCECFEETGSRMKNSSNQYAIGNKGTWRAYKSFAFLTDRDHTWRNNNTNIRKDGMYTSFNPFWKFVEEDWAIDETNWTWTSEITSMNPYGAELENVDALGRYSSATYGYNHTIPTSVAANARYSEIAFDAFEDYGYVTCSDDHFSYRVYVNELLNENISHTGIHSLRVGSTDEPSISRDLTTCIPE